MKQNIDLLKKGLFSVAIVSIIGATTVVYAAANNSFNASLTAGYGNTGEQALAAIDQFNADYTDLTDDFVIKVRGYLDDARDDLVEAGADEAVTDFSVWFEDSSNMFFDDIQDAQDLFKQRIQSAASLAESKDEFINLFSQAKAQYFNDLDAAKNQMASRLSNLGNNANVVKDMFMNRFNSARDMYGNELEQIKNTFADTINNIR